MKLTEQLARTAVIVARVLVSRHIKEPNSQKSRDLTKRQSRYMGIHALEIHRFYNALLKNNVHNSFTEERAGQIAFALIKATIVIWGKLPDKESIQTLRTISRQEKVSLDLIMTLIKAAYHEILEERLKPGTHL